MEQTVQRAVMTTGGAESSSGLTATAGADDSDELGRPPMRLHIGQLRPDLCGSKLVRVADSPSRLESVQEIFAKVNNCDLQRSTVNTASEAWGGKQVGVFCLPVQASS
jgi:hypothetical protein